MAGFFNTNWDLGNMFISPYSNTGFYNQDEDNSIVPRPGNEGPEAMPTNTWGAPTGYDPSQQQQGNMFNPYSAGGNNFYNPYSFGQTTTGTQYGGGQQPWWMNYNMVNPVNPPNIPTTNVQPQAQGQPPRNQGTGPNGKDLTYAETIKYFGLYNDAESAFAAGDSQAAYRKDHQQWRDSQGYYSTDGLGKQEGQSDLDYTGRTIGDNTIMGDRQKLAGLSGLFGNIPDNLKALFSGNNSGSGMNSNFLNRERGVEGSLPYNPVRDTAMQSYLNDSQKYSRRNYDVNDLQTAIDAGVISSDRAQVLKPQEYDMMMAMLPYEQRYGRGPSGPVPDWLKQSTYQDNTPRGMFPKAPNGEQLSQTMVAEDNSGSFSISDIAGAEIKPRDRILNSMGFGPRTNQYSANDKDNIFIQNLIKNGTLSASDAPMAQINPYGMTDNGMTRPATEQEYASNVLNNNYPRNMFLQDYQKSLADTGTARIAAEKIAAEQAQADAFIAAQNEKNREAAQAAAAEKERQATAAQARMNNNYETGPVPKNIFTSGTGGSSSGRGGRAGRTAPAAPKAPSRTNYTDYSRLVGGR